MRIAFHCIVLASLLGAVRPVEDWKEEIEHSSGKVIVVRIDTDPQRNEMKLPEDAPQREILRRYLAEDSFRAQLAAAHALTVNYTGAEGAFHFVLLNMALAEQWKGAEDGLLAHELGHAWLHVKGYRSPEYAAGARGCVAMLAGDIVQHVLIRAETKRRGIPDREYWIRKLQMATQYLESGQAASQSDAMPPCQILVQLAQWIDVRLGFSAAEWAGFDHLQELYRAAYPRLIPYVDGIENYLRREDLSSPERFSQAVTFVQDQLEKLYDQR